MRALHRQGVRRSVHEGHPCPTAARKSRRGELGPRLSLAAEGSALYRLVNGFFLIEALWACRFRRPRQVMGILCLGFLHLPPSHHPRPPFNQRKRRAGRRLTTGRPRLRRGSAAGATPSARKIVLATDGPCIFTDLPCRPKRFWWSRLERNLKTVAVPSAASRVPAAINKRHSRRGKVCRACIVEGRLRFLKNDPMECRQICGNNPISQASGR